MIIFHIILTDADVTEQEMTYSIQLSLYFFTFNSLRWDFKTPSTYSGSLKPVSQC